MRVFSSTRTNTCSKGVSAVCSRKTRSISVVIVILNKNLAANLVFFFDISKQIAKQTSIL